MRIYLDHNATTPVRPEVVEAMLPALRAGFGNPSSTHEEGAAARRVIEEAREQVASGLGCAPAEVIFTGGATESNNTVLAALRSPESPWRRLVTTRVEHPSVLEPARVLEQAGVEVHWLEVDAAGIVDLAELQGALGGAGDTLVSILWANNETGVLQPIDALAQCVRAAGATLHVDATQAVGKLPIELDRLPISLLSSSAHKLGGPKGTGCLVVRDPATVPVLMCGGPQERRARGGTENVAGIAGFGAACALAESELPARAAGYAVLRDRLWDGLVAKVAGVRRNGAAADVLPNTLNVEFEGAAGEVLLQALDVEGIAVSAGAACHSGSIDPSHVLTAMGRTPDQARAALRLSVGYGNDEAQIDAAVRTIAELVPRAREAAAP
jgi:cysteine desulfurase